MVIIVVMFSLGNGLALNEGWLVWLGHADGGYAGVQLFNPPMGGNASWVDYEGTARGRPSPWSDKVLDMMSP